jgi:glycosyltransferase involved in cell wall biosynthesis
MPESRRLSIVHTEASLGWGGQEIRILSEAAGMIRRGHTVRLLCPPEARIFREAPDRGVPAEALPIGRKNLRGLLAMRGWLATHRVDVVNTHSSTDSWLAALACATLGHAPALVRTRHISAAIPDNLATRWLYGRATRTIVTTGERLREQLVRDNGFDAKRIVSVPTGIDTTRFVPGDRAEARARLGLPSAAAIVGIVATLRSWKGHVYLLDAFAGLGRDDARLVIVGDGPQREAIANRIAELGLGDRVTMPGNQNDVLPWLQSFDVFALPSYANEGVPQAILQAMLCGLPVVTTDVGSIGEAIVDGDTGLVVPPKQAAPLAEALVRLLDDAGLRSRLGTRARAVATERFGLESMLDHMERVFLEASASRV